MNSTATNQDAISARPTTQKMPPAYSPVLELAKPTGRKPAAVTSVPVSIGNAVEVQAKVAALARSKPCSIFTTIISIAMMASSTSSPSAMMSAPSVMRCRSMPAAYMTMKTIASTSGTESATTMPVRSPSVRKLTSSTIAERFEERLEEFRHRAVDDVRLVGDLGDVDADRKLGGDRLHRLLEALAQRQDVGAVLHRDAETERRPAAFAHDEARRVLVAAPDGRDVAQPEDPAVGLHRHRGDRLGAGERAGHAQMDAVGGGVDRAAGDDGILPRDAVEDLLRRDAERRELARG